MREILTPPSEWLPLMAISFGYPTDKKSFTIRPLRVGRKAFDEVVHWERW